MSEKQVIGYSPEEQAASDRIDRGLAELNAALDKRIAELTPGSALQVLDEVVYRLPLLVPALRLLGLGEHAGKLADAAKIIKDVVSLTR